MADFNEKSRQQLLAGLFALTEDGFRQIALLGQRVAVGFELGDEAHHHFQLGLGAGLGDGLMAVFGLEDPANAVPHALAAGRAMAQAMTRLNPYLQTMYCRSFRVRFGLHYGDVVVGHIGGLGLRKLAIIGDTVNIAARIETANKDYGTTFLVSQAVVDAAGEALVVRQGFVTPLKGKKGVHRLYEVDLAVV